ncbi:CvpA family protein [Magnetospira thiophila]
MENLPVNAIDIAVALVLLLSGMLAYSRGFVHEVLSIAGWLGAIFVTIYGLPLVRPYARELIPVELAADLAAGAVLFIGSLVILSLVSRALSRGVRDSALNVLDRSLGFLFGLIRGGVLVSLAWIALDWAVPPEERPSWVTEARSLPLVVAGAEALKRLVPEDLAAKGATQANQTRDDVNRAMEAEKVLRQVIDPQLRQNPETPPSGYDNRERKALERLIQTNQ